MSRKIFSLDAETNGLWGTAFAIGAVVKEADGSEKTFIGRCPIEGTPIEWVSENVLPQMEGIPVNYPTYRAMLEGFFAFYMENKEGSDIIVHVGFPVEARLFIDAHNFGILGDWDAPFPLIDISAFPEIGASVDSYNESHGLKSRIPDLNGGTHSPLYDSYAALVAYESIISAE